MVRLVVAAALVYGILAGVTLYEERWLLFDMLETDVPAMGVVFTVFVVPLMATWGTAEFISWRSRKRIFDRRLRAQGVRQATAGVVAALVGVAIGTLALVVFDRILPDAVLLGMASVCSTALVLLPMRRQSLTACPSCGYDLSGASPAGGGVCTECGFDVFGAAAQGR
jgi:hypothetical protein